MARLGSRFSLLFEPYRNRIMHSAIGRIGDQPLDFMVGLVDQDGQEYVLPFSTRGQPLRQCEQFDRLNSITFRGQSQFSALRFEFNIHSVFYPKNERLSLLPAFYMELRINPAPINRPQNILPSPLKHVRLFLRIKRPNTDINVIAPKKLATVEQTQADDTTAIDIDSHARIDLAYDCPIHNNQSTHKTPADFLLDRVPTVPVRESIVSLSPHTQVTPDNDGLMCELPLTAEGSGVKWRLIWGAHIQEPVAVIDTEGEKRPAKLHYTTFWNDLPAVLNEAATERDNYLTHSRRLEKAVEQAPLETAQQHLLNQTFQNYLSNTTWCDIRLGDGQGKPWFSVMEGSTLFHSTVDVEYNASLFYLTLWPKLLQLQLLQWTERIKPHAASNGAYLPHDMGYASLLTGQAYPKDMPVEENSNFLLMLQAYTRWTGDKSVLHATADVVGQLTRYLEWTDRNEDGFPSEGMGNTVADGCPAIQVGRKNVYIAIKRLSALRAAADLLGLLDQMPEAHRLDKLVETTVNKVQQEAWLGDHFAVCMDCSAAGMVDPRTNEPLPSDLMQGWDAYSIYTGNGLLLPHIIGQPPLMDEDLIKRDITASLRENMGRYGCGHSSMEVESLRISQNLWRDALAHYFNAGIVDMASRYWDLQVMSNTHAQSLSYTDTYTNDALHFFSRGIVSFSCFLSGPRLIVDKLAPGGAYITVNPQRHYPQRWPLLALTNWDTSNIPVCVVDNKGNVTIESCQDPVIIQGDRAADGMDEGDLIG